MHTDYINPAMRQLRDQQVRFAPKEKKLEEVNQAERLLGELDTGRKYSYEYLCFRITRLRPTSCPDLQLPGEEASHDLRLFVEDVSDSADVPADKAGERVLTVDELAKQLNVSTKTISRWRRQGLVSRRFVFDGRKRVGFLQSSVDRFVNKNGHRVDRGKRFSQLTDEEREKILKEARRFARAGGCPAEITRRLSRRSGRRADTIRHTLRQHDSDHPDAAIFPYWTGHLTTETKRVIYQQFYRGESTDTLSKRFCRTRTDIYHIVAEMRAQRVIELPLDFIPNEDFPRICGRRERTVLGPMLDGDGRKPPPASKGLPAYLASLYEVPLLTREQEMHLFRKMNYLKYKAASLRERLDPARPKNSLMDWIEKAYDEAVATKNQIILANLRLVVSIAKRHVGMSEDFFELVSDGNISLMRAVEKFDYSRGNRFSTYALWAIIKNYARTIPGERRQHDRFRTGHGEMFATTQDGRTDPLEQESIQLQREFIVGKILDKLNDREQKIIIRRFGLKRGKEPLMLKEVAAALGVTKERIRQLQARALSKLRKVAEEESLDFPE